MIINQLLDKSFSLFEKLSHSVGLQQYIIGEKIRSGKEESNLFGKKIEKSF